MRKLMIGLAVLALCGVAMAAPADIADNTNNTGAGDPATARVTVGLSVAKYAEVNFNTADLNYAIVEPALELQAPGAGWVKEVNWLDLPIQVRSNCDVRLELAESLSDVLANANVPRLALWGSDDHKTAGTGDYIYNPTLMMHAYDYTTPYQTTQPNASREMIGVMASTTDLDKGPVVEDDLPEGGRGFVGYTTFRYGRQITDSGGWFDATYPLYDGNYTSLVTVGTVTENTIINGWDWTDLQAGDLGTFKVYATVMVDGI